jgi:hypothetical protein
VGAHQRQTSREVHPHGVVSHLVPLAQRDREHLERVAAPLSLCPRARHFNF